MGMGICQRQRHDGRPDLRAAGHGDLHCHARPVWLPLGSREIVPDIGRYLPECRRAIAERGFAAGQLLLESKAREQGWPGLVWTDPFHPAFFLHLGLARQGKPRDYLRSEDFASGEVATRWNDAAGRWRHRMFVSRPDNLIVLQIIGPAAGKLSGSLSVDKSVHPLVEPEILRGRRLDHRPHDLQERQRRLRLRDSRHGARRRTAQRGRAGRL